MSRACFAWPWALFSVAALALDGPALLFFSDALHYIVDNPCIHTRG